MQKDRIQVFALYAEIISSVAVLATLIFLVIELRENTEVARSSAYSKSMSELNTFRISLNSSELLLPIWVKYLDQEFEDLSRTEEIQMNGIIGTMFGIYEDAYYSYSYGIMGETEWLRFEGRVCENYARVENTAFLQPLNRGITAEFTQYIITKCE